MAFEDFDWLDVVFIGLFIALTSVASQESKEAMFGWAIFYIIIWVAQHFLRRSLAVKEQMQHWQEMDAEKPIQKVLPLLGTAAQKLLTDGNAKTTNVELRQDRPLDVNVVNVDSLPWHKRITQPLEYTGGVVGSAAITTTKANKSSSNMNAILRILPTYIKHNIVPNPPTPTSVPIGYNPLDKTWMWADFGLDGDTIHALIAGQSGSGKDSQLRLWFTMLTANNTPDDIQFVILDGKGEWLTPSLLQSIHMYVKPAGGVELIQDEKGKWIDAADERMEASVGKIFEEIARRNAEFQRVGATNIEQYQRKTGIKLPLIIIMATDVGTNIENNFERLVKILTFKGRSFGIRLIVSMQTVSGQDTGWRGQLALAMSGYQQYAQADTPNLGISVRNMLYRPSELPSPDDKRNRGIFVVRNGSDQYLVKTAHISDDDFERYCENILPKYNDRKEQDELLSMLLVHKPAAITPERKVRNPLSIKQMERISSMAKSGFNKTDIMIEMGFTSGPRYKEVSPFVDILINAAQRMTQQ